MAKHLCKFCGKEFNSAYFLTESEHSCGECSSYCMKNCEIAKNTRSSWHKESCVSCKHNPYRKNYTWDGDRWIRND